MEYLWFIILGVCVLFLMSRGRGGMGCCGGSHDSHHSSDRAPREDSKDVIDLREDEYTIIAPKGDRIPRGQGEGV